MEGQKKFPKWLLMVALIVIAFLAGRGFNDGGNDGGLRGRFVSERRFSVTGPTFEDSIEFTRNRFVWTRNEPVRTGNSHPKSNAEFVETYSDMDIFRVACRGTFSITGNRIELNCNDAECGIQVTTFSQTQNTLDIFGRFYRE